MAARSTFALLVLFLPSALPAQSTDLSAPTIRKEIAAARDRIAAEPRNGSVYIELAYAYIDAGMGELAWEQARKATQVAPNAADAFNSLAWVLQHNAMGVNYGKGYPYEECLAAHRRAIELDPNDLDFREHFSNTLEYSRDGIKHGPDARLADAITVLRYVKARQHPVSPTVEDNLLIDLFYSGRYAEIPAEIVLPGTPMSDATALATTAATQGSTATITMAGALSKDPARRNAALELAAVALWSQRLYPQAADLLAASIVDRQETHVLGQIQIFRKLKPYENVISPNDPRWPIQLLIADAFAGTLTEASAAPFISPHAYATTEQLHGAVAKVADLRGMLQSVSVQADIPILVMRDIVLGSMQLMVEPGEGPGYRLTLQVFASKAAHFFVVREEGTFKIVASTDDPALVANEAAYLHQHGREAEARALLDWMRLHAERTGPYDPLGGLLFARFWTSGQPAAAPGAGDLETAVAALQTDAGQPLADRARLIALQAQSPADVQLDLDLLLATAALNNSDPVEARRLLKPLLARYSDSPTAIRLAGRAARLDHDWPAWTALLEDRLRKHPGDLFLLRQQAEEAEAEGDIPRARRSLRHMIDTGNSTVDDDNTYAWLSLLTGTPDEAAEKAAEQANLLSHLENFAVLHTLASVKAARGNTADARPLLLQAMTAGHLTEPDSAIWFSVGLIDEQYGVPEAAIAAYRRVQKPVTSTPSDTYSLAQTHLKQLQAR